MNRKFQTLVRYARSPGGWSRLVRYGVTQPGKAWSRFVRLGSSSWIKHHFDDHAEYARLVREIEHSDLVRNLHERLANKFRGVKGQTSRGNPYIPGTMSRNQAFNIYALIRKHAPTTVVETGVCNGLSTAVFLAALKQNGIGHLYSIDYPEFASSPERSADFWEGKGGAVVPADEQSGWLVPEELRGRWTLMLGKSRDKLPPLLADLGVIDLFVHDSEHSLENQLFEFGLAFQHLRSGGLLLASDITWSNAFDQFWGRIRHQAERRFIDDSLALVAKLELRPVQ
jgi:predicted O-methyltransferase YrrM